MKTLNFNHEMPAPMRRKVSANSNRSIAALGVTASTALIVLLGAVLTNSARGANFPPPPALQDEHVRSMAVFKILVKAKFYPMMDGSANGSGNYYGYSSATHRFTSPLLQDNSTWIGLSVAHCQNFGDPLLANAIPGVPCSATPPYDTTATSSYSELPPVGVPPGYPSGAYNEVFSYMINMQLVAFSNCFTPGIPQVPDAYDKVNPMVFTGPQFHPSVHKSVGRMVSGQPSACAGSIANYTVPPAPPGFNDITAGFPANSYWNMYVNAFIPSGPLTDVPAGGFYLYNDPNDAIFGPQPLIVQNAAVDALPPSPIYIHGGTLYAVPVKFLNAGSDASGTITWAAGETFGQLLLSGHQLNIVCGTTLSSDFVDAVLGPPKQGNPEPPALWAFPTNSFPSPGSTYNSQPGTNFGGGSIDEIYFTNTQYGVIYLRSMMQGTYVNPIDPPPASTQAMYDNPSSSFSCEVSIDDTNFYSASGFGSLEYVIANTGTQGNATLYDLTVNGQTNVVNLNAAPNGPFLLRASMTKDSKGKHTIIKSAQGGYFIATYLDMNWELSDDSGDTWYPANRPIRMGISEPACGVPGEMVSIKKLGTSAFQLSWSNPGYTLQGSTSLSSPAWVNIPGTTPITLGNTNAFRFFRIVCNP